MGTSERSVFFSIALAVFTATSTGAVAHAATPCNRSLLKASASIDFIEPDGATLTVRHPGMPPRQISVSACLVPDDIVILPPNVKLARVFAGDRLIDLTSNQPIYHVEGGIIRVTQGMADFVSAFANVLGSEPVADLPRPTATRALGLKEPTARRPIVGLDFGDVLQKIPGNDLVSELVVAWQAPPGQAHCSLVTPDSTESPRTAASWCAVSLDRYAANSALKVSFDEPMLAPLNWQLGRVANDQVPRPSWLAATSSTRRATDIALWGLWLYREAPVEWRLAGLGMLYSRRHSSWLAARAYRTILAGDLRLAPVSSSVR